MTENKFLSTIGLFFGIKRNRRALYLLVLIFMAFWDLANTGLSRRTFVFHSSLEDYLAVEERLLYRSPDRETDIRRYLEEALLGPVSPGLDPLFPRETRLHSFMYRDAVVYANLGESAALPLSGSEGVFLSLFTLNEGIRRNFPYVKDVKIFIGGNEVFYEEFRRFF